MDQQLGSQLDYILDGGPCTIGVESTIIGFENHQPVLYRRGGITQEQITEISGPLSVTIRSSNPSAPGMLDAHYAPKKSLRLTSSVDIPSNLQPEDIGRLCFSTISPEIAEKNQLVLSPNSDLSEAAQNLFAFLRQLDEMPIKFIFAEPVPDTGLGKAINDRLQRASS